MTMPPEAAGMPAMWGGYVTVDDMGAVWTIGAWCQKRDDFRIFRLDRIKSLCVLDENYPQEKGRTLQDLIDNQKRCS